MSRIGKSPITLPAGVEVNFNKGVVTVKGPKGELTQTFVDSAISLSNEEGVVTVTRATEQKRHKALHGLYRSLVANMVEGVSKGYSVVLELHGVGYRASNKGQLLELSLGYSHPIYFAIPAEVKLETKSDKGKAPLVMLSSIDKQLLGQVAAKIRAFRKPEPYKGKGVRFQGEEIRRKEGKAAGK